MTDTFNYVNGNASNFIQAGNIHGDLIITDDQVIIQDQPADDGQG